MRKFIVLSLIVGFVFPLAVFARVGVGIGTGEIRVTEDLKPGGIYEVASLNVRNTGDEAGFYELAIAYKTEIAAIRTPKEWFSFSPSKFYLEPGESQMVAVKLTLPLKAQPGKYFNYVQARPAPDESASGTSVGIAVAAKLFFTVIPANLWQGITWRVSSFWKNNSPWTWIVLAMVFLAALIVFLKKTLTFQVGVKKK